MLNTTVTTRAPGLTIRRTVSATLLRTVTLTVTQEPAAVSEPDGGDTVTWAFGLVTTKLTGPPTAVTRNVALAGLPAGADSTIRRGVTCRVPGGGGGGDGDGDGDADGDGDGDGDADGDGEGEPRVGADDRGVPGDVARPGVGPSAGDVCVPGDPGAGVGARLGEGRAAGWLDAATEGATEGAPAVANVLPPSATVEAWARCVPPETSSAAIPPATTARATAATAAAARGRRRTPSHHRGPGGMTGFGNPVGPNAPARCVTLARCARPVGELSAPPCSTRSRRLPSGLTSAAAPSAAASPGPSDTASPGPSDTASQAASADAESAAPSAATPAAPSRRRHSFRATACSQAPSWSGSRSPWSLAVATVKVSATASAASPGECGSGSMDRQ